MTSVLNWINIVLQGSVNTNTFPCSTWLCPNFPTKIQMLLKLNYITFHEKKYGSDCIFPEMYMYFDLVKALDHVLCVHVEAQLGVIPEQRFVQLVFVTYRERTPRTESYFSKKYSDLADTLRTAPSETRLINAPFLGAVVHFITSRVSGQGNRISPVCVCLSVN